MLLGDFYLVSVFVFPFLCIWKSCIINNIFQVFWPCILKVVDVLCKYPSATVARLPGSCPYLNCSKYNLGPVNKTDFRMTVYVEYKFCPSLSCLWALTGAECRLLLKRFS